MHSHVSSGSLYPPMSYERLMQPHWALHSCHDRNTVSIPIDLERPTQRSAIRVNFEHASTSPLLLATSICRCFNPHPASKLDATDRQLTVGIGHVVVSILIQPQNWMLRSYLESKHTYVMFQSPSSLETRCYGERFGNALNTLLFQSPPSLKTGCYVALFWLLSTMEPLFQSSLGVKTECNQKVALALSGQ